MGCRLLSLEVVARRQGPLLPSGERAVSNRADQHGNAAENTIGLSSLRDANHKTYKAVNANLAKLRWLPLESGNAGLQYRITK